MAAKTVADGELPPTHPIRLGLALNYSVFMFEVMGQEEKVRVAWRRGARGAGRARRGGG